MYKTERERERDREREREGERERDRQTDRQIQIQRNRQRREIENQVKSIYFSNPLGVSKRTEKKNHQNHAQGKVAISQQIKECVYTNLDSFTHSPFRSTQTHTNFTFRF